MNNRFFHFLLGFVAILSAALSLVFVVGYYDHVRVAPSDIRATGTE